MFGINPYAPYGIPPGTMGPATGQMNPQYQNNYISPQNAQKSGPDWVTVPTVGDIRNVGVQAGTKAWIMAQNDAVFAVRTADQRGVTTTEYYRFARYDPEEAANAKASEEYVTRTEWNKLIESLGGILEE